MLRYFWMILLGLALTSGALAGEIQVLTLEQCMDIAMQNNPGLKMAEKEASKAKASIWEAYTGLLPAVNGSVNFQKSWEIQQSSIPNFIKSMVGPSFPGYDEMPDVVRIAFGLENTFTYGAQLTQPLFLGGAGIAGVKMAYSSHDLTIENLDLTRQNLIYNTADAFYRCLTARELVRVQEEALEQAEANLDLVMKMYDVGSASGYDKMRAEVTVANIKPEVIASRNNLQSAETGLRTVLGLPESTEIQVQGSLEFENDNFGEAMLNDLLEKAFTNRPEMAIIQARKSIARSGVDMARSEFLPKIFFSTDYSFLAMRNDYRFNQDDFSKGFTSALSLQVPLFNSFKRGVGFQKARLDYQIALDTEKQVRDGMAAEVEIVLNKFGEAREKYQAAEESVALAREALRLANLMYEEGASTQLDVLSSQLSFVRARLNHVMALYEYQMARYALRRATVGLNDIL